MNGARFPALSLLLLFLSFSSNVFVVDARPVVRAIKSAHEFDRLIRKHGSETGLPVIVDFYSDGCGPCRMMAPIFKQVAKEYVDRAVFVKVDTNAQYELSSKYQIRSLPTFMVMIGGSKWQEQKGGIGEAGLKQLTEQAIRQAELENVKLELEDLVAFYQEVDPNKPESDVKIVYSKCTDLKTKKTKYCQGAAAQNLVRKLKKKYKKTPKMSKLFEPVADKSEEDSASGSNERKPSSSNPSSTTASSNKKKTGQAGKPNLHLATKEELQEELERRLDEERDQEVENEDIDEEDALDETHKHSTWTPGPFPERVVIIGGGPAGMASALYAARAGLAPLVIAPSMGGQLQGKGVEVENFPGLQNVTGPAVISLMRAQAAHFGALFEEDVVVEVDASKRPLRVVTNATGTIEAHAIIVATGADSKWLDVPGEYELRGGGVSSCATCDGFLFSGRHVVVVGGGDAAMEDALVLARTSKKVTLVHRRDTFRASKVLADRVIAHPLIDIEYNTVLVEIKGKRISSNVDAQDGDEVDLDEADGEKTVSGAVLKDVLTGETRTLDCDAVFVAIGHTPNTGFLDGVVEFDPEHPGYIKSFDRSTRTSIPGIFAAGDVSDAIYRQAITSAGSGAAAALDAERYLSEQGLGNEAAELEAELLAELMGDMDRRQPDLGYNAYDEAGGRMEGIRESVNVGSEL